MAVDTPAKIAVLGCGPIGLEAALYGRYLGYDVEVFERGEVAENVLRWGHARLWTPFCQVRSTLGLAALAAQDPSYQPPEDNAELTGRQWADRYLIPLAKTDLLEDQLRLQTTVISVTRGGKFTLGPREETDRDDSPFRVLLRDRSGRERYSTADIVVDATGTYGNPNGMGQGSGPAIGESSLRERIEYGLPDVLGAERDRYEGTKILLIGDEPSTAITLAGLSELVRLASSTQVTWVSQRTQDEGPISSGLEVDAPAMTRLTEWANACAGRPADRITCWLGTWVEAIAYDETSGRWAVDLAGCHAMQGQFDRVIANVGYRPDLSICRELRFDTCYASECLRNMAKHVGRGGRGASTGPGALPPERLLQPEPDFYVLGAKSYGRNPAFLMTQGLEQIRDLFKIIGGRSGLDLYASVRRLLR